MLVNNVSRRFQLSRWQYSLLAIFAIALIIRGAFVLTLKDGFYFPDSVDYSKAAVNLVAHGEFSEGYGRAPGYPVLLAGIYALFGQGILIVRLVETLLGAYLAVVIAMIAKRIAGEAVGTLSGLLWSIYPTGIFIVGLVYPTNLATLLLACATLCMVPKVYTGLTPRKAILGGIFFGLAALTVSVVLATILAVALWIMYWQAGRRLWLISLFLLGTALPLAPWTVRNFLMYDRWVLIEPRVVVRVPPASDTLDEPEPQQASATGNSILDNAGVFARRFTQEFGYFWELSPHRIYMNASIHREMMHEEDTRIVRHTVFGTSLTSLVSVLTAGPLFLFALVGAAAMVRQKDRRRALSLFCATVLSFAITYSFFFGKMRYRIPVEPYLVILAAYGLRHLWLWFMQRSATDQTPASIFDQMSAVRSNGGSPHSPVESPAGQPSPL